MTLIRLPRRPYVLALICYLAIPVVVIAGAAAHRLIDPEIARGSADYVRNYQWLERARLGALAAAAGLALVLGIACCYLVLRAWRQSPRRRTMKMVWRVPFEVAVFLAVWVVAYQLVVLKRELMIRLESFTTGTPISAIIAQQTASSGMWAAGEGMEMIYLVGLMYLLRPFVSNRARPH